MTKNITNFSEEMDILWDEIERVHVRTLAYNNTDKENQKEVVFVAFDANFGAIPKNKTVTIAPLRELGERVIFAIKEIDKEYDYKIFNHGDSYRHIYMRKAVKNKITHNSDVKRAVTPISPIIFLRDNPTFEDKERLYQVGRTMSKYAYIPNMMNALILAGHIDSDSKEEAQGIIEDIKNGGINKINFNSKKYALAQYYIDVYKKWVEKYYEIAIFSGLLKEVETRINVFDRTPYFIEHDDNISEPFIQDAIKNGELSFTKNKKDPNITIINNNDYTEKYAVAHGIRINNVAKPLHYNGNIREDVREHIVNNVKRRLFEGQINAVDAMLKSLDTKRNVTIIGEMGTGKTLQMATTAYIHSIMNGFPLKCVVFSPDHIVLSGWDEEIRNISDDIEIHHIKTVSDLIELEKAGCLDDDVPRVFILGQGKAKRKFSYAPYPVYSEKRREFSCSKCGEVIKKKVRFKDEFADEYYWEMVPVSHLYFNTKNPSPSNSKCKSCGEKFWAIENKNIDSSMFYSKAYKGFLPKDESVLIDEIEKLEFDLSSADNKKKKGVREKLKKAQTALEELRGEVVVTRRISDEAAVAHYIFKKLKRRFNYLIADEVHEFQGNSLRYEACKWLVKSIRYTITGTGTAMNGYANSRFRTDFLLNPANMIANGYKHDDADKFQEDFGVIEKRFYEKEDSEGKIKRVPLSPKKKPSINPAVFPKFMQDCCVFVTMDDMGADMPNLDYIPMPVKMDAKLESAYTEFMVNVQKKTAGRKKEFASVFQMSNLFLDAPQKSHKVIDKRTGATLVSSPVVEKVSDRKLETLIEIAHNRINVQNKNMLVYVHFKEGGLKEYLKENLENQGFRVSILNSVNEKSICFDGKTEKVEKDNREYWIRNQVNEGAQIVICNPYLVQTGCNLIETPIIVNYQLGFNSYVIRQADRRAWRLNQTVACEVINIFYADTIQQQVASLMATKIVSARSIEGQMDSDGLEALCDSRTAEEEMAAEFYKGIKNALEVAEQEAV